MEIDFITLAAGVNDEVLYYMVDKVIHGLNREKIIPSYTLEHAKDIIL